MVPSPEPYIPGVTTLPWIYYWYLAKGETPASGIPSTYAQGGMCPFTNDGSLGWTGPPPGGFKGPEPSGGKISFLPSATTPYYQLEIVLSDKSGHSATYYVVVDGVYLGIANNSNSHTLYVTLTDGLAPSSHTLGIADVYLANNLITAYLNDEVSITLVNTDLGPFVPTPLTLSNLSSSSIMVSWPGGPTAYTTSYTIQYRVHGSGSWTQILGIAYTSYQTTVNYVVSGLAQGTQYDFQVQAVYNTVGSGFTSTYTASTVSSGAFGPIPVFPTLPIGYPVKVSPNMDTIIGTTKSLREMRVALRHVPLWDFEIKFEELVDQTQNQTAYAPFAGEMQYEQLVQLWISMYGQANVFAFDCPWDDSRSNQQIGTGDGTTTTFTVYRTWGLGANATLAPVGMVNTVYQVQVNGVTVPSTEYYIARDTIVFKDASGNPYPPGNGYAITMTFSFYYLCRFVEDEQDFEEFAKNRWTVPSLKFRSVYWP